jgi:hypothetical protein
MVRYRRCTLVRSFLRRDELVNPDEITVTQASRAPGRVPSERATAWRSEYSVASVTSTWGHGHHHDGDFFNLL